MYPTIPKLMAGILFAGLAWVASRSVAANLPPGMDAGRMAEINAILGVVMGWRIMGARPDVDAGTAMALGLTTSIALALLAILLWAGVEMVDRSMNRRYDGVMAALEGMIAIAISHGRMLWPGGAIPVLAVGGAIAGVLTAWTARRFGT